MLENPYINVLFFTLSLTGIVFLGKYLYTHFTKKKENINIEQKEKLELSTFLWIAMIILCSLIIILAFKKPQSSQLVIKPNTDTIYKEVIIHDTVKYYPHTMDVKTPIIIERPKTDKQKALTNNSQKIDSGSSGLQNNAINYGNQAGRDINNYGIVPRVIKESFFKNFFKDFPNKNTRIAVGFEGAPNEEMINVKSQIIKILRDNGYINIGEKSDFGMGSDNSGISYEVRSNGSVMFWISPN